MKAWPLTLKVVGTVCVLLGSLDPLEGSILILAGTGLLLLAACLGRADPHLVREWVVLFLLMAFGVGQLWELSAFGGFGGDSGRSMWWGLLIVPYPVAWIFVLVRILAAGFGWLWSHWHRGRPAAP